MGGVPLLAILYAPTESDLEQLPCFQQEGLRRTYPYTSATNHLAVFVGIILFQGGWGTAKAIVRQKRQHVPYRDSKLTRRLSQRRKRSWSRALPPGVLLGD